MTDEDKRLYDKAVETLDQMDAGLPSEIEKYVPAWIDGYKEGLKAKINATTISDRPIKDEQGDKEEQLEYAKTIIQDLLDNSDEYARQRAMDFLEEEK